MSSVNRLDDLLPRDSAARSSVRAESGLVHALCFVVAVKLVLLAYIPIARAVTHDDATAGLAELLGYWLRWDAPHYLELAEHGYTNQGERGLFIVFLPLYPWVVRVVAWLVGDFHYAALLVSTAASLTLGWVLYRVTERELGAEVAGRTVLLMFVFPTSYVLHIAYTESLFIALAVGSMYAARQGRWKMAGLLGMGAALTRVNGAILFPVLLLEAWLQRREGGSPLRRVWPVLLVPGGVLIYLCVNYAVYGDPLQFLQIQREHWHKQLAPPWQGLWSAFKTIGHHEAWSAQMLGVQEVSFAALAIAATLASARWLRATYTLWMAANTLLFVSTGFLQSVPRYCLTLFPMMMLAARACRSTPAWTLLVVASSLLLALFSYQFSLGRWAF